MFKLVVLSVLIAVAVAAPSAPLSYAYAHEPLVHAPLLTKHAHVYAPARTIVEYQPEIHVAKVGAVVEHVPTAVSHQSQTVVHSKAAVVTPVLATYAAAPAHLHAVSYAAAPVHLSHGHHQVVSHHGHEHLAYGAVPLAHAW